MSVSDIGHFLDIGNDFFEMDFELKGVEGRWEGVARFDISFCIFEMPHAYEMVGNHFLELCQVYRKAEVSVNSALGNVSEIIRTENRFREMQKRRDQSHRNKGASLISPLGFYAPSDLGLRLLCP